MENHIAIGLYQLGVWHPSGTNDKRGFFKYDMIKVLFDKTKKMGNPSMSTACIRGYYRLSG